MKRLAAVIAVLILLPAARVMAQAPAPSGVAGGKVFVDLLGGAMRPGGEVAGAYDTAPAFGTLFAVRVARNVAVDGGFEVGFNASRYSARYTSTLNGSGELSDYELMVPMGAQLLLPLAKGHATLSGGGGLSYLRFGEYGPGDCSNCGARSGWGVYEVVQFRYFPGAAFGLGVTARFVQATTDGIVIGSSYTEESKDRWTSILGSFSLRF